MLKTQIVECSSIINWIFSTQMKTELTSFYIWEILNSTVNRMNKHVEKLQTEFNEFEENFKKTTSNNNHVNFLKFVYSSFSCLYFKFLKRN